jgi:hypothetical protein
MSISMHAASAPVFLRTLGTMVTWLDKAQAHAESRRFDSVQYLGLKLAPDMLPFSRQVQIACDAAKGCMARLAGIEVPSWPDDEATLAQLRDRILRTCDYVGGFTPDQLDGAESRPIALPTRQAEPLRMDGLSYLRHYALANFFFHSTLTYALLRHAGVELGKADFLGRQG